MQTSALSSSAHFEIDFAPSCYLCVAQSQYSGGSLQWGSEYRPFEYRKHLRSELQKIWYSNIYIYIYIVHVIQAMVAQLLAYRLGTRKVPGSNPSKGENFSVKKSNWIVRI